MEQIQTFEFVNEKVSSPVRVIEIDSEPWFVGKDVANVLGYTNPQKALRDHVDEEDSRGERIVTPSGTQVTKVINESGLYSLILSSKLPTAKKFKHWVTSVVLPNIRKTGSYSVAKDSYMIEDPIERAKAWIKEQQKLQEAKTQLQIQAPKVTYFDQVIDKNGLTNFRDTAKMLGWKPRAFNQLLEEHGYIYRTGSKKTIKPYAEYVAKGYFEIKDTNSGFTQTLITPKGRAFFNERFGAKTERSLFSED